jgi:hypothetical protein
MKLNDFTTPLTAADLLKYRKVSEDSVSDKELLSHLENRLAQAQSSRNRLTANEPEVDHEKRFVYLKKQIANLRHKLGKPVGEDASAGASCAGGIATAAVPMGKINKQASVYEGDHRDHPDYKASRSEVAAINRARRHAVKAGDMDLAAKLEDDLKHAVNHQTLLRRALQYKIQTEGYEVRPSFDRERYQERDGLEGPFSSKSGKVVYYDPREGKYYDPDTDFYLDNFSFDEDCSSMVDEKAPPGMEDVVMKLKKEYPNDHARAFATAWSMYNKKHGKKEGVEEESPKFQNVSCSQCGQSFGPGNSGFSHCADHEGKRPTKEASVTDYTPKSHGGTRAELLAKYEKSKSSNDATNARKAGASQSELHNARTSVEEADDEYRMPDHIKKAAKQHVNRDLNSLKRRIGEPDRKGPATVTTDDGEEMYEAQEPNAFGFLSNAVKSPAVDEVLDLYSTASGYCAQVRLKNGDTYQIDMKRLGK